MNRKSKGEISIENAAGRIRLRWRVNGERYGFSLPFAYTPENLLLATTRATEIKLDILTGKFDATLGKYQPHLQPGTPVAAPVPISVLATSPVNDTLTTVPVPVKEILLEKMTIREQEPKEEIIYLGDLLINFNYWVKNIRSIKEEMSSHYPDLRKLFTWWGECDIEQLPEKFNAQNWSPSTFNSRMDGMKGFFTWMVSRKKIPLNPLDGVQRRPRKRDTSDKRRPFTEQELIVFLNAIRNDTYNPPSSGFKHSNYYPYILFLALTGVRNAEGIGLRVKHVNMERGIIEISETMARTIKGTHSSARIRKGTKKDNVRYLPMTDVLRELLQKQIQGKQPDDLVFTSPTGLTIDDRMLQRRVLKPILRKLEIAERDLYVLRHNFGTKAIEQGMLVTNLAYVMGHSTITTVMRNYISIVRPPTDLPHIVKATQLTYLNTINSGPNTLTDIEHHHTNSIGNMTTQFNSQKMHPTAKLFPNETTETILPAKNIPNNL